MDSLGSFGLAPGCSSCDDWRSMEPNMIEQMSCWVWDATYSWVEVTVGLPCLGGVLLPGAGLGVVPTSLMNQIIQLVLKPVQVWKPRSGSGVQGNRCRCSSPRSWRCRCGSPR